MNECGNADGESTVVVGLLEVHIYDTSGPDACHVRSIDSPDFSERAGLNGVATVFGEESWD